MRANPTPGLSRLAPLALLAALVGLGACTPQLDLDNRPPPCLSGQIVCGSSGTCMTPAEVNDKTICRYITVRQGASNVVPVPGFSPDAVTVAPLPELVTNVVASGAGSVITVSAPHGTVPGDRRIPITTNVGGVSATRYADVIVSQIAVRPDGNDQTAGTVNAPFQTLRKAASVAAAGDTIKIFNGGTSTNGVPTESAGDPAVTLPAGITIVGEDGNQLIAVTLQPQGSVEFDNVRLLQRLSITAPASKVSITNVIASNGVTVAASATGTTLEISGIGATEIRSDNAALPDSDGPLAVLADGASVTVRSHAKILPTGSPGVEAIRLTGHGQTLTLLDADVFSSSGGITTLGLDGATTVNIQRSNINGRVEISEPTADAIIANTDFYAAQGGGILFRGATMLLTGSTLHSVPLEQDQPGSRVTVRKTSFLDLGVYGAHLVNGYLDLGSDTESGANAFVHSTTLNGTAIDILAPEVSGKLVTVATVSGTTFDGVSIEAYPREGPIPAANGIYSIAHHVALQFY